jgi:hypothetical protein
MKSETEIWQVKTGEEVYQADLLTLKQWIGEGLVQPTDLVRKGSLKWIEAGRAPALRRVFTGEEQPPPPAQVDAAPAFEAQPAAAAFEPANAAAAFEPLHAAGTPSQSHADAWTSQSNVSAPASHEVEWPQTPAGGEGAQSHESARAAWSGQPQGESQWGGHEQGGAQWGGSQQGNAQWGEPELSGEPALSSSCHFHPMQAATLVCRACHTTFCRACPNQVKSSSVFLCPLCGGFCDPLESIKARTSVYEWQSEGFGLGDFRRALAYPFRHTASLVGGALLYAVLLLGGLRAQLLAWALLFGCISLVIRRVGYGKLERDFMPDFGDFSFWDDVILPLFLGVGITVVTIGPVILLIVALLFGWFGRGGAQKPFALAPEPPAASRAINRDDLKTLANGGSAEQEAELERKVQAMTPRGQMAQAMQDSKDAEESTALTVARQLMSRPGLILLLALLALGWAVFYYPMALLVAGWTEEFKKVINPLVGLDTMRHMGATYFKAFLMYAAVEAAGFFVGVVVAVVTSPFNMPFVGNLPGKFVGGAVTFYSSLVVACVLGLALFKSADRLGIEID